MMAPGCSGLTLVKVGSAGKWYVIRFWNKRGLKYWPQDLACQLIASAAGYGSEVLFSDQQMAVSVMEYLEPQLLSPTEGRLSKIVELLKKIHGGPVLPPGINRRAELIKSIDRAAAVVPASIFDVEFFKQMSKQIFTAIESAGFVLVPCHRDLHPGNVIYTRGRFFAIDYTLGGMADAYTDLATIAFFECSNDEEDKVLLELYLERAPTPAECAKLSLYRALDKLYFGIIFLYLTSPVLLEAARPLQESSRAWRNFGRQGGTSAAPEKLLEYGLSLLIEVSRYAQSGECARDIALLVQ
ncbi:MAG: hypothetical protein QG604_445 [Candidatus Dependentiae bacterium]|nr:hypothetical protein [Candidatus Dependentiae bacterium]MDQ5941129.1 hypothetical protein [Candidatus Dependentiae bacterium]